MMHLQSRFALPKEQPFARRCALPIAAALCFIGTPGCSSGSGPADAGIVPSVKPVSGPIDTHCQGDGGIIVQPTNQSACHPVLDMTVLPVPGDGGTGSDDGPDYGATMYNTEGYDDDCKYHVRFSLAATDSPNDIAFHVTAFNYYTNTAALMANIKAEVFLSDSHPAPNSSTMTTEGFSGNYTISPVRFDAQGRWTVRFHLYEDCDDTLPDSPHGHAAFYLDAQ